MMLPIITAAIMLGGSFDLKEMMPRDKIFNPTADQIMKIENTHTQVSYKLIESSADVTDFLDVQGELALKMKKGSFDGSASGSYLKERVDRTKTVELLIHMNFENYTETFPSHTAQVDGWETRRHPGTHYIRSIVYGGQLIVTYRLSAHKSSDLEKIKAAVKASLENSGSFNFEVKGKLNMINNAVKERSDTTITAFYTGTSVVKTNLFDLDAVFSLIEKYPKLLTTPSPIRFELESLSSLKPDLEIFKGKTTDRSVVNQILDDASDKYEDTNVAMSKCNKELSGVYLTDEEKEKRNSIYDQALDASDALELAIGQLDMSEPFNPTLFDDAFAKYATGGYNVPNRFTREITELINKKKNYVQPWYSYTMAVTEYTRWGNDTCSLPSPDPIFVGFAMGAPKGFGSGSDIICVTPNPELVEKVEAPGKTASISGLAYQTVAEQPMQGTLICSRCQLENATSVFTVPAKKHCPEGTKLEYKGYLATGTDAVTDPICIDGRPKDRHPNYVDLGPDNSAHVNFIKPLWMKCTSGCYKPVNYVHCVVCSR